jgi:hypothetical protein
VSVIIFEGMVELETYEVEEEEGVVENLKARRASGSRWARSRWRFSQCSGFCTSCPSMPDFRKSLNPHKMCEQAALFIS